MSNAALDTQGTKLYLSQGSPTSFALITERVTIGAFAETRPRRDVTDLDSLRREYKGGLRDSPEMPLRIFYLPSDTQHAALRDLFNEDDQDARLAEFKLEFTDGTIWIFDAEVSGWTTSEIAVDGDITADVSLLVTGEILETPAA